MVISTFISDLVLSLVSFYVSYQFKSASSISYRAALYGFTIIATSAGLGAIHFLGINVIDSIYSFFVGLASCVGVPLLGLAFFHLGIRTITERFFTFKVLSMFIGYLLFVYVFPMPMYSTIVGGISMVIILIVGLLKWRRNQTAAVLAISGAALFVIAGLVVGTRGKTGIILNVDIFHILLAIANLVIGKAILKLR
ncbi:MAG: hypothetical protein O9301_11570 [Leptospira sp.]|nr:hypothetical protein [Leptospira sp.]